MDKTPLSQRTTCRRRVCFDSFQIAFATATERDHSCGQGGPPARWASAIQVAAVSGFMHRQGKTPMPTLTINGRSLSVDAANDTPLLWAIREQLQMTGTKFGCGAGLCGACTVHVNGEAVRSCQTMVGDVAGKKITTIEGLSTKGDHPLQKAWVAEQVPQCGYCQSGQIMQAASLLAKNPNPTKEEVVAHMDGNLCRCMTYSRIQKAIMRAASEMRTASATSSERRPT
ncbi:(2Fe-2S)-binding protein [Bradyrhizobium sp. Y36]|nr:(2Fe-2S)-binding protein [Bradyrhizobium sp. Y36]